MVYIVLQRSEREIINSDSWLTNMGRTGIVFKILRERSNEHFENETLS